MTEAKRGRGRPKKVVEPINPDYEPATKGFVKCIARKLNAHKHTMDFNSILSYHVYSNLFLFVISACVAKMAVDTHDVLLIVVSLLCAGAAIVILCAAANEYVEQSTSDTKNYSGEINKAIQKYEPPTCEPKKECE